MNARKRPSKLRFVPRIVFALLISALGLSLVALSYAKRDVSDHLCLRCAISKQAHELSFLGCTFARWDKLVPTPVYELAGREVSHAEHEFVSLALPRSPMSAPNLAALRLALPMDWRMAFSLNLKAAELEAIQRVWSGIGPAIRGGILMEEDRGIASMRSDLLMSMRGMLRTGAKLDATSNFMQYLRNCWNDPWYDPRPYPGPLMESKDYGKEGLLN